MTALAEQMLVLLIIAAVIVAWAIIIWIARRRRRESALNAMRVRTMAASTPKSHAFAQVQALMAQDRKLEAISTLREATGMGLSDAKAAVEILDTAGALVAQTLGTPSSAQMPAELAATVRGLLQSGDKIAAIKLVRERMKLDLKNSKDLVDKFERM